LSKTDLFLNGIDFNGCDLPPLLPLVHTVSYKTGMEYINKGALTKPAVICDVFHTDNPVYLFYGKPAYKKLDKETSRDPADHKMVFILKNHPKNPRDIIRVLPFDSGAFHGGFFNGYIDPTLYTFNDFQLSTDINELPKLIWFFWETNTKFFKSKKSKDIVTHGLSFAISAYYNLIKSDRREAFDDRCYIPEVQSEEVPCILDYLQAIVVSDEIEEFYLDGSEREKLESKNIDVIPYYTFGRTAAQDISHIYYCIFEYYRDKEVL
jgi:hypothetical protein